MAESDEMRDELRHALVVALTVASVARRAQVNHQERAVREQRERLAASEREATATAALARARFAAVEDPPWWADSDVAAKAAMWDDVTRTTEDPDVDDAVRSHAAGARAQMGRQLRDRYGVDPDAVEQTVAEQLAARDSKRAGADADAVPAHGRSEGVLEHPSAAASASEAVGGVDRSEQLRSRLAESGAPEEAVEAAVASDQAFPRRTDEVARSRRPAESAETDHAVRQARRRRR